jgi:hypothetical protein
MEKEKFEEEEVERRPITWMHLVTFALVTGVCTVLAIFAVIAAPVPPAPGVSGLYIAAAVYVPVSLWFGIWGALAGYVSCVLLGIYTGMPLPFLFWWSLADFFEGIVPLTAFRIFRIDPEFKIKKEKRTAYTIIMILLIIDLIVAAFATANPAIGQAAPVAIGGLTFGLILLLSFILAVILMIALIIITRSISWVFYTIFGVLAASIVSAIIGATVVQIADISAALMAGLSLLGIIIVTVTFIIAFLNHLSDNPIWRTILYIVIGIFLVLALILAISVASKNPAYPIVLFGWGFGDIIVLSTIGTMLMVTLTPFIKRTQIYIKKWVA